MWRKKRSIYLSPQRLDPNDPVDPVDPIDLVDPNTPCSMLNKSSEEKIVYLRTLCMDQNYQNIIEVLVNSDKVSVFFLKPVMFANIIIEF